MISAYGTFLLLWISKSVLLLNYLIEFLSIPVCQKNYRDAISCCYEDPPMNSKVSTGIKRMFGEWSVSFDTLVVLKLYDITKGIAEKGIAPEFDRQIAPGRKEFLRNFAMAQMIAYEAAELGTSVGWFYWNFKMEGMTGCGAAWVLSINICRLTLFVRPGSVFAEWDFLRGIREGWLPTIPPHNVSSEEAFQTTCHNLIFRTDDTMSIVNEFPDPKHLPDNTWFGDPIDDDVVVSHGDSLLKGKKTDSSAFGADFSSGGHHRLFLLATVAFFGLAIWHVFLRGRRERKGYTQVNATINLNV